MGQKTKVNWVVLCTTFDENKEMHVLHACCYEDRPDYYTLKNLAAELKTDEEFGMTDLTVREDYNMMVTERYGTDGSMEKFLDDLGIPKEFEID